jgi:hypothetical protein
MIPRVPLFRFRLSLSLFPALKPSWYYSLEPAREPKSQLSDSIHFRDLYSIQYNTISQSTHPPTPAQPPSPPLPSPIKSINMHLPNPPPIRYPAHPLHSKHVIQRPHLPRVVLALVKPVVVGSFVPVVMDFGLFEGV